MVFPCNWKNCGYNGILASHGNVICGTLSHEDNQYRREGGGGVGGVISPGPGSRRGPQKRYILYYNNYQKPTAGAQQNLGKLLISGILSGPGLVLVVII